MKSILKKIFFIIFIFNFINNAYAVIESFNGPFRQDFDYTNEREKTLIYLPENYNKEKKFPLLVSIHGFASSASLQNIIFDFKPLATEYGFILAVPNGIKGVAGLRFWNGTDFCCGEYQKRVDDVQYLTDLIDGMADEYSIDKNRIYLFGHSNGGFMSYRMACEAPNIFAAMGSFAGATFKNPKDCPGKESIPVLQIHGTSDLIISYDGNQSYPSAKDSVKQWTEIDNCRKDRVVKSENTFLKPLNLKVPHLKTIEETWESCENGSKVSLWTIEKGEHLMEVNKEYLTRIIKFLFQFSKK